MNDSPRTEGLKPDLTQAGAAISAHRGWFLALGIVLLVLGVIAAIYVVSATLASVLIVGALMLVGGISQLIHAWRVKGWSGFLLWSASGVLYTAGGVLVVVNPMVGAAILTLLLGAALIASGALRLWVWLNNRGQQGAPWLALSGLVTLAAGILVAYAWPGNSLWILGLLLAFDLFIQGWALIFLGASLSRLRA